MKWTINKWNSPVSNLRFTLFCWFWLLLLLDAVVVVVDDWLYLPQPLLLAWCCCCCRWYSLSIISAWPNNSPFSQSVCFWWWWLELEELANSWGNTIPTAVDDELVVALPFATPFKLGLELWLLSKCKVFICWKPQH